ncbi:carboxypeptidase-like regulatory domain-containing protein [Hymenobacter aerilatus]|uniref:carboxypeptidase-like regulatory domain-containing protein n=1 Tax=Hymenobacter aerilatus TaxID=2932251 RepID=UPI0035CAD2BC
MHLERLIGAIFLMILASSCEQIIGCDGIVIDSSGNPIANVRVTLRQESVVLDSTTTDSLGRFYASQLIGYVGSPPSQSVDFKKYGFIPKALDLVALYKRRGYSSELRDSMVVVLQSGK